MTLIGKRASERARCVHFTHMLISFYLSPIVLARWRDRSCGKIWCRSINVHSERFKISWFARWFHSVAISCVCVFNGIFEIRQTIIRPSNAKLKITFHWYAVCRFDRLVLDIQTYLEQIDSVRSQMLWLNYRDNFAFVCTGADLKHTTEMFVWTKQISRFSPQNVY